jgi:hypothetical protein
MDCQFELNTIKSIQILGLDVEYFGHVSTLFRREKIQYPSRIEEIDEEDKIQKCTPVRVLAKLIGKLSTTRTQLTQASLYLKQLSDCLNIRINKEGWDTYIPWEYRMIGEIKWWLKTIKTNKPHPIITNPTYQAVITTDTSPITWGATSQVHKKRIISRFYRKKTDYIAQQT